MFLLINARGRSRCPKLGEGFAAERFDHDFNVSNSLTFGKVFESDLKGSVFQIFIRAIF